MFKPHFQDATATAIIEGLAVSKYNHGASKWNVVFLRNCGHYPRLIIREVERRSGRVVSEIKRLEIAERDSISITVSSPAGNIPWIYQTDGPFNRNPSHDAQDFRWMLDIQQLHGREVPRTGSIPTNSLSISNGCFYTSVRTKSPYRKRWINPDGTETPIQEIGLTGRTFGADFKAASVTVRVTGENDYNGTFDHRDNSKYEIIFALTRDSRRQTKRIFIFITSYLATGMDGWKFFRRKNRMSSLIKILNQSRNRSTRRAMQLMTEAWAVKT
jgi:hypothetical protein